jgi:hypothetical protein
VELREKKQTRCRVEERAEAGDRWDHTALAAARKLIVARVVGKRPQAHTQAVVRDAKQRLRPGHLPAICTDASESDEAASLDAFGRRYLPPHSGPPGRSRRPSLRWPQGWAYGPGKNQ